MDTSISYSASVFIIILFIILLMIVIIIIFLCTSSLNVLLILNCFAHFIHNPCHMILFLIYASLSTQFHVFEMMRTLPRFSMYALVTEKDSTPVPTGCVSFTIGDRINRVSEGLVTGLKV